MGDAKLIAKAAVLSATALLLGGCSSGISATGDEKPEWPISVSQSSDVTPEIATALDNTDPQYKKGSYTAAFLPLGESVEGDKKIIKFAMKANLPVNCLNEDNSDLNEPAKSEPDCLTFMVSAAGPLEEDAEHGYKRRSSNDVKTTYLQNTKGNTVLEITAPSNADFSLGSVLAGGGSATINLQTGENLSPKDDASAAPAPTVTPSASSKQ